MALGMIVDKALPITGPLKLSKLSIKKATKHFPFITGQFFSGYLKIDADQGMLELYADQLVRRTDPQQRSLKLFFEEEFARKCGKFYLWPVTFSYGD